MPGISGEDIASHFVAALRDGDFPALGELFQLDAYWHVPGHSTVAGDYEGREAILDYFEQVARTAEQSTYDPHFAIGESGIGVAQYDVTLVRPGRTYEDRHSVAFSLHDGQIVDGWLYVLDLYTHDLFFGWPPPDRCPICRQKDGHDPDCPLYE